MKRVTVMPLGLPDDRQLEVGDEIVVAFEQREGHVDAFAHAGISEVLADAGPIRRIGEAPTELRPLILGARVLDVREQWAALPDEVEPTAQKIAGRSHGRGIHVGLRQETAPQQGGDLERVEVVILGLASMDGLHG
jgi:hypothetical protein